jgi:hypothetical protein
MLEVNGGHRFLVLRRGEIVPEVFYERGKADAYFEANKPNVAEYIEEFRKAKAWSFEVWSQRRLHAAR